MWPGLTNWNASWAFWCEQKTVGRVSSKLVSLNLEGRLSVHSLPQIKCTKSTQCSWKLPNELKNKQFEVGSNIFHQPPAQRWFTSACHTYLILIRKRQRSYLSSLDKEIALVFHKISDLSSSGFYTFTVNVRLDGYMRRLNRGMYFRGHGWIENSSF